MDVPAQRTAARATGETPTVNGKLAIDLRCGRCGAAVGRVAVPVPPPFPTWVFELRTLARPLVAYAKRQLPTIAPALDAFLAGEPYAIAAELSSAYSDAVTCAPCCARLLPPIGDA